MGLFDKLFGKGKKNEAFDESIKEKTETAEANNAVQENSNEQTVSVKAEDEVVLNNAEAVAGKIPEQPQAEKITAVFDMFPVKKGSVSVQRNNEICSKYINDALTMGQELTPNDLQGLTYEELCMLYNHMQMMNLKLDSKIKNIAKVVIENNMKVLRAKIIEMMKKRTLYTLYTRMSQLPFSNSAALYLFTDKKLAEMQIEKSEIKYLLLKEIPAEHFETHFDLFYMTGFTDVIVDTGVKLKLEEIYTPKDEKAYGIMNPEQCRKMVYFNQMTETFSAKAKVESREVSQEELRQINGLWADITEGLIRSVLLLPAEKTEDGKARYRGAAVTAPDKTRWIAMFTDQFAVNMFFRTNQLTGTVKDPILSQYAAIKDNSDFEGIIINPTRESFRIPSRVLASRKVVKPPENGSEPKN